MTIRRQPSDFVVRERLSRAFAMGIRATPDAEAREAVYVLRKESRTTPEAIAGLARALAVPSGSIGYAGLKDKHARTEQHVSARARTDAPREIEGAGWSASLVGWSRVEIASPAIEGNLFEIVVRDLTREASGEMDRRAGLLGTEGGRALLVVNYFGAQRFGSARHGRGYVGRALIDGDFELALRLAIGTPARKDAGRTRVFTRALAAGWGDWTRLAQELPRCPERRAVEALASGRGFRDAFAALPNALQALYVEAYQSKLWNDAARRFVGREAGERGLGTIETPDEFGVMRFLPACEDLVGLPVPIPGKRTELTGLWGEALGGAMREEGIEPASLRVPGLRRPYFGEAERSLVVRAEEFAMSPPRREGARASRTLAFALPRGSYATVVLRALGQ